VWMIVPHRKHIYGSPRPVHKSSLQLHKHLESDVCPDRATFQSQTFLCLVCIPGYLSRSCVFIKNTTNKLQFRRGLGLLAAVNEKITQKICKWELGCRSAVPKGTGSLAKNLSTTSKISCAVLCFPPPPFSPTLLCRRTMPKLV
jgi:hypothetical protein